MKNIEIRKTTLSDLVQLSTISRATFLETFSATNTAENMNSYVANSFSEEKLAQELNNPGSEFFFALDNGIVIGYLKVNYGKSQTELKDETALEIERIYVLKEYHGQKVGQLLYDHAVQLAKQLHASYVWLGVWEENPRAISFYTKNGFVPFDTHVFVLGDDKQTDIMMRKMLD